MTANVVCTGRRYDDPAHPGRYQLTTCATGPGPRPWKGERATWWSTCPNRAEYERRATAKPCPRCGGRVKLIEDGER